MRRSRPAGPARRLPLSERQLLWLLALAGLGLRFLLWPFSHCVEADAVDRTLIAWRWLSAPELITHGNWGPLHTYLIALALWVHADPVVLPVLLNIVLSAATVVPLHSFVKKEFGPRGTLLASATFLFYPVAVRHSLMAVSETPFVFLVALALHFLAAARGEHAGGKAHHALLAGLSLTAAGMLRYEAWVLMPLLGLGLLRRPRLLAFYLPACALFPVFWMAGNAIHLGDPLYSFHYPSWWQIEVEGYNDDLTWKKVLLRLLYYPQAVFWGLTPALAASCLLGAVQAARSRAARAVWLVPPLALGALFAVKAAQGDLLLRSRYSIVLGLLLIPFAAPVLGRLEALRPRLRAGLGAALLVSLIPLAYVGKIAPRPLLCLFPYGYDITPLPRHPGAREAREVAAQVRREMTDPGAGWVCDFFEWVETYLTVLEARLPPGRVWIAPGGLREEIDCAKLHAFLAEHPRGVLLLRTGSRLERAGVFAAGGWAPPGGAPFLALEPIAGRDRLRLYRYRALDGPPADPDSP